MTTETGYPWRHAVRHYLEMVASMLVGMVVLGAIGSVALGLMGWHPRPGVEIDVLVMATTMAIGMAAWMRHRGHRWVPIVEMSAAMYVPFLVLFPPFWLGVIPADGLMLWGHVLMLPAMAVPMLMRPAEYACHPTAGAR